jgi:3-hydroxyisobutyrate dehydrogenase
MGGPAVTLRDMIAFFGTGLLGGNFVRALRRRGEEVHVWNRTVAKARALEADGARAFEDPAQAARGAERIHLSLSDDAAVDEVLERARAGLSPSVTIVDHTTTSATGTAQRAKLWAQRGVAFLHSPVFMGPQNALEGTGIMLASGDRSRFDALSPHLSKMTGKLVYLGPQPERAAGFKLMGNLFLMFMTTGVAETLRLARALDIPPDEAATLFGHFNPGLTLGARVERMLQASTADASWELSMARKDARLMMEEAARAQVALPVLPAIAELMDRFIASGHGRDDWTIIGKDVV